MRWLRCGPQRYSCLRQVVALAQTYHLGKQLRLVKSDINRAKGAHAAPGGQQVGVRIAVLARGWHFV